MKTTINFDPNVVQGHQEFPPETIESVIKKPNQMANRTLNFEAGNGWNWKLMTTMQT